MLPYRQKPGKQKHKKTTCLIQFLCSNHSHPWLTNWAHVLTLVSMKGNQSKDDIHQQLLTGWYTWHWPKTAWESCERRDKTKASTKLLTSSSFFSPNLIPQLSECSFSQPLSDPSTRIRDFPSPHPLPFYLSLPVLSHSLSMTLKTFLKHISYVFLPHHSGLDFKYALRFSKRKIQYKQDKCLFGKAETYNKKN